MRALGAMSEGLLFISGAVGNLRGIQRKGNRCGTQSDEHLRSVKAVCKSEDRNLGDQSGGFCYTTLSKGWCLDQKWQ